VNGAASAAFWARHFQAPWLLPLAVVLPALFAGLVLAWGRARARRVARLAEPALAARLAPLLLAGGGPARALRLVCRPARRARAGRPALGGRAAGRAGDRASTWCSPSTRR
jgi:hypothetical protein